jgi:hypothetical protein
MPPLPPPSPRTEPFEVHERAHTLHLLTPDEEVQWTFDRRGRLMAGHDGGFHYLVGMDGCMLLRDRRGEARPPPSRLTLAEAAPLYDRVAADAAAVRDSLPEGDGTRSWLARAAARDAEAYHRDAAAFTAVYQPVSVLPPDCYRALVVQLTEGCCYNRCAFCTLYRDVPYRVKNSEELETHLTGIEALFGEAQSLRNKVFLGDANALALDQALLLDHLERVRARFPDIAEGGFYSFLDTFTPPLKTEAEFSVLREAGLRRVYVGLESGHRPLRAALRKPGTVAGTQEVVARCKRAGVRTGIIVLVGAGGADFAEGHLRDTTEAIRAMDLGADDLVYLSPLVGALQPPEAEIVSQAAAFKAALNGGPFRLALYDLRRWIY